MTISERPICRELRRPKSQGSAIRVSGITPNRSLKKMKKELIFGAAALGNRYGQYAAPRGKVLDERQSEILPSAHEHGFTAVDTAPAYGMSEKVIGKSGWVGEIHTKLNDSLDPVTSVRDSLQKLQRSKLDLLYLFHEPSAWMAKSVSEQLKILESLRPYAGRFGVSVYETGGLGSLLAADWIDVIQVPGNIWDQDLLNFLKNSNGRRPKVFVRSIFLQGLLLRPKLPRGFEPLQSLADELTALSNETGRSRMELAAGWVLSQEHVDGIILGAQSATELEQISETLKSRPLNADEISALAAINQPARSVVDPRNWK